MTPPIDDLDPREYGETLQLLRTIDFLKGVPDEKLKGLLFSIQKETFSQNKTILFQGEIANRLFIIHRGTVKITAKIKGNKVPLADLPAGTYFGEISLLRPTSATATATSGDDGAQLLILTHDTMSQLSKNIPDIEQRIQKIIDERIASKNKAKEDEETK